jgi:hypothetical protein
VIPHPVSEKMKSTDRQDIMEFVCTNGKSSFVTCYIEIYFGRVYQVTVGWGQEAGLTFSKSLSGVRTRLAIRASLLQPCGSQGPRHFHLFTELPFEIRQMIWKFSLPAARSIRVHPLVPEDRSLGLLDHSNKRVGVLDVGFSYEDNDSIACTRELPENTTCMAHR